MSVCHVHHQTNCPACPQVHLSIDANSFLLTCSNPTGSAFSTQCWMFLVYWTAVESDSLIGCGIQVVWHGCKARQFQKSKVGQTLPSAKMFPNQPHGFTIVGHGAVCHHYAKSIRKAAQRQAIICSKMQPSSFT